MLREKRVPGSGLADVCPADARHDPGVAPLAASYHAWKRSNKSFNGHPVFLEARIDIFDYCHAYSRHSPASSPWPSTHRSVAPGSARAGSDLQRRQHGTLRKTQRMESFNLYDFGGLESPYSNKDQRVRDPIGGLTNTFDPLTGLLPDPLLSEITTSSSPSESINTFSPALTEEEAAHVDNLLFFGVDSPILPLDLLTPPVAATETPPALVPVVPEPPSTQQAASSVSPLPASCALFSPTTVYAAPSVSPPALQRRFSLVTVDEPNDSQGPTQVPPDLRPSQRRCFSYPGESSFQLDTRVAPLKPTKSAGQPTGKPPSAARTDYSACRCLDGLTSKPARHWRACPYNPNAGEKRFTCELCGKRFTREDNKFRHREDYH